MWYQELTKLLKRIDKTHSFYIRCLKPNSKNVPNQFDTPMITRQLKFSGVLEAVKVARAGYPIRFQHSEFILKYKLLYFCKDFRKWLKQSWNKPKYLFNYIKLD